MSLLSENPNIELKSLETPSDEEDEEELPKIENSKRRQST